MDTSRAGDAGTRPAAAETRAALIAGAIALDAVADTFEALAAERSEPLHPRAVSSRRYARVLRELSGS